MSIAQIQREPLERFMTAVGNRGHIYNEPRPSNNDMYRWVCGGNGKCREIIDVLLPYLCEPKREQIQAVLDRLDEDLTRNPRNHFAKLRERIVQLRADGLSSAEIASAVGRSRSTIRYHLRQAGQEVR